MRTRLRELRNDDGGFTLIEMVVTLVIMGIVMILFSGGITQIYHAEEKTESTADTESQLTQAFQRLDKGVRYASAISLPALVGVDPYVEYQTSNTGTAVCTEIRIHLANNELQQRTWVQGMSPLVPSAWTPLASQISAGSFIRSVADPTYNYARLEFKVTSKSGTNANSTTKSSDITFTALNTSYIVKTLDTVCTEARGIA